jgi:hypothetical protein
MYHTGGWFLVSGSEGVDLVETHRNVGRILQFPFLKKEAIFGGVVGKSFVFVEFDDGGGIAKVLPLAFESSRSWLRDFWNWRDRRWPRRPNSLCQKPRQAEAPPPWLRKLLIRGRGAGAFACEPGVIRLLTRAANVASAATAGAGDSEGRTAVRAVNP